MTGSGEAEVDEPDASSAGDVDRYWRGFVTGALLGTDRREPPEPPAGPVGDLLADAVRPDDASRMLAAVGAVAAVRRAAFVAGPSADRLQAPASDDRPWCSAGAATTWRTIVEEWPVLEDEWLTTVIDRGLALPPDVLVELLLRHRRDDVRRARVAVAGGPTAHWLVEHLPDLAPAAAVSVAADEVTSVPELPVPPELAELLTADGHTFVRRLRAGFDGREFGAAHRAVLVNLIARCRPAVLVDAGDALEATRVGMAIALADLARLRHRMLTELGAPI